MSCLTISTSIATLEGERPIEELVEGDRVITRDHGLQSVMRIRTRHADWSELAAKEHLRPILIRQGALGFGLPECDMMVSPNQRMLVRSDMTSLHFDQKTPLVAAKHLLDNRGVHAIESIGTTYFHLECDGPEMILANGSWVDCFHVADAARQNQGNSQRNELVELFPEHKGKRQETSFVAGRITLKRYREAFPS